MASTGGTVSLVTRQREIGIVTRIANRARVRADDRRVVVRRCAASDRDRAGHGPDHRPLPNSNRDWSATAGYIRDLAHQYRDGGAGILHFLQRGHFRSNPHRLSGKFQMGCPTRLRSPIGERSHLHPWPCWCGSRARSCAWCIGWCRQPRRNERHARAFATSQYYPCSTLPLRQR